MQNHLKTSGELLEFKNKDQIASHQEMSEECKTAFQELKIRKKHRYIIFKMGETYFDIDCIGLRTDTFQDFKSKLPYTDCRFCIYDHEYTTHDGRPASKLYFISWFPNNSTPYQKMAYTTSKTHFHDNLTGVFDIQASSVDDLEPVLGPVKTNANNEDGDDDEDFDF